MSWLRWPYRATGLLSNVAISISCSRQCSNDNQDHLAVTVNLSKGDKGSINLHDGQVRVRYGSNDKTEPLIGIDRRSHTRRPLEKFTERKINWDKRSKELPFLRLTTGESTQFSCYFQVPHGEVCTIEVVILGMKQSGRKVGRGCRFFCVSGR